MKPSDAEPATIHWFLYLLYLYWYLLPEGYSEEDIVLDENGGRNVFEKMFFLPKVVDLLKVEFNLLLEGKKKKV